MNSLYSQLQEAIEATVKPYEKIKQSDVRSIRIISTFCRSDNYVHLLADVIENRLFPTISTEEREALKRAQIGSEGKLSQSTNTIEMDVTRDIEVGLSHPMFNLDFAIVCDSASQSAMVWRCLKSSEASTPFHNLLMGQFADLFKQELQKESRLHEYSWDRVCRKRYVDFSASIIKTKAFQHLAQHIPKSQHEDVVFHFECGMALQQLPAGSSLVLEIRAVVQKDNPFVFRTLKGSLKVAPEMDELGLLEKRLAKRLRDLLDEKLILKDHGTVNASRKHTLDASPEENMRNSKRILGNLLQAPPTSHHHILREVDKPVHVGKQQSISHLLSQPIDSHDAGEQQSSRGLEGARQYLQRDVDSRLTVSHPPSTLQARNQQFQACQTHNDRAGSVGRSLADLEREFSQGRRSISTCCSPSSDQRVETPRDKRHQGSEQPLLSRRSTPSISSNHVHDTPASKGFVTSIKSLTSLNENQSEQRTKIWSVSMEKFLPHLRVSMKPIDRDTTYQYCVDPSAIEPPRAYLQLPIPSNLTESMDSLLDKSGRNYAKVVATTTSVGKWQLYNVAASDFREFMRFKGFAKVVIRADRPRWATLWVTGRSLHEHILSRARE